MLFSAILNKSGNREAENMVAVQEAASCNFFSGKGLGCVRNDTVLFNGISFTLEGGEILQIQGPNGSGKTTLLRILCGLALADEGEIFWNGKNIHDNRHDYFRELSYIGHVNGIKTELTALENLDIAGALAASGNGVSLREALVTVGLAEYENTPAQRLSSGQRRRLALARLLITATRIWILDEPFTALDDYGKRLIKEMIATHAAGNGITVLATHDAVDIQRHKINTINL